MESLFESIRLALKKSLNAKFVLYNFALSLATLVIVVVALGFFLALGIGILLATGFHLVGWIIGMVLFLAFVLFAQAIGVCVRGVQYFMGKEYLAKNTFSFLNAWNSFKPRAKETVKLGLVIAGAFWGVVLLALLPVILAVYDFASTHAGEDIAGILVSGASQLMSTIIPLLAWVGIVLVVLVLLALILVPFLTIVVQHCVNQKTPWKECMRSAWGMSRKKYIDIWVFSILFIAIVFLVSMVQGGVEGIFTRAAQVSGSAGVLFLALNAVVQISVNAWIASFAALFAVLVYALAIQKPVQAPRAKKFAVSKE